MRSVSVRDFGLSMDFAMTAAKSRSWRDPSMLRQPAEYSSRACAVAMPALWRIS
jgi:hypothetical protein